ncbi:MAG TPA: hypothetical protein DHW82_04450 [Spirochaetia bacterium]|nr:MAG: hypothetical protein A2Y41_10760 [Spirochaetes bacterium GWB1_36_13]HCL56244.1 hypothetical protein [Spirochaetia bacterium]
MKKKIFVSFFLFFSSCSQPEIPAGSPDHLVQEINNNFQSESYGYFSYNGIEKEVLLKSKKVFYNDKNSRFELEDMAGKIKSGEDYIFLMAKKGYYKISEKNFEFYEKVKFVIENKYLIEGFYFLWDSREKFIKGKEEDTVFIKDNEGVLVTGTNFISTISQKQFNLQNSVIQIPEKMAEDEGFN